MANILFETQRLLARHILPGDVSAMHAVYGDADAMRFVGDGEPIDRAGCLEWIAITERNVATRGYGMTALVDKLTGEVMGFCGLVHPGGQPEAEIKYALLRSHWGRGYATEAAAAMLAYGLKHFGLRQVIATAAPGNHASHRVLEKAGLQRAELRQNDDGSFTQLFRWQAG